MIKIQRKMRGTATAVGYALTRAIIDLSDLYAIVTSVHK